MFSSFKKTIVKTYSKSSTPVANGVDAGNLSKNSFTGPYTSLKHLMAMSFSVKSLSLPKAKRALRPQTGLHQSKFRGRGMEFSEVRVYQPGDDVRSIDWRVTARRQTPHTKLFEEERERPLFIICDQSQSQFFGSQQTFKSVRAAETAALFSWAALEHNDRIGGIVFSERGHMEVKPARSRKSIMKILSYINDFNNSLSLEPPLESQEFSINDALNETIRLVKPGTLIIIISDFFHIHDETQKQLSRLAKHSELMLVRTFDPIEETLPPPGFYPVSNGAETLVINSRSKQARQDYQNWALNHKEKLMDLSRRIKAPYIEVSTIEDPVLSLQRVLLSLKKV